MPSNAPISYTVNGKQHIAIGVGYGGTQATGFASLVPEIQNLNAYSGGLGVPTALIGVISPRELRQWGGLRIESKLEPSLAA